MSCRNRQQHRSLVPKNSGPGASRQKRPFFRQHFLNRLPLPQGHRSLRPSFSSNSLPPWTTRTPRLTCVSDGNPRRRLLIGSKPWLVVIVVISHDAPSSALESFRTSFQPVLPRHRHQSEVRAGVGQPRLNDDGPCGGLLVPDNENRIQCGTSWQDEARHIMRAIRSTGGSFRFDGLTPGGWLSRLMYRFHVYNSLAV